LKRSLATTLHPTLAPAAASGSRPIWCVSGDDWPALARKLPAAARAYAEASGFKAEAGGVLVLPGADGKILGVLFGIEKKSARVRDAFLAGKLAAALPAGVWRFETPPPDTRLATLAFVLGTYKFTRYRKADAKAVKLVLPKGVDGAEISRLAEAVFMVRDLVNTPANDLGPDALEDAAKNVAKRFGAKFKVTKGDRLKKEFPLVHAVGQAAEGDPRLIDFTWGNPNDPKVTLVGKGVCFDTGGLDLKPGAAMLLMKKDMGGAANALGLAQLIMGVKLPVRLRVLIPAVENSVSDESFRPGDVYKSRKGITVEVGNTDAEGRLILCDALALADEEKPELLIDFATLTGSARVALGPELPAAFTDDDRLAADLARFGEQESDPIWRMPLWRPYQALLDSKIADTNNISGGSHAGAITAALFLARFVEKAKSWLHLDLFAWNPSAKPGRPEGGEAQTIRALYALLKARYGK
jgi:leucyl aminopeptidase